jgi:hypothetical protein
LVKFLVDFKFSLSVTHGRSYSDTCHSSSGVNWCRILCSHELFISHFKTFWFVPINCYTANQTTAFFLNPYLLVERNEMEKLYRGPYIDAYCQVWFYLAKLFQRRRLKYEKVNGRTTDAKWFGPGELKNDEKGQLLLDG